MTRQPYEPAEVEAPSTRKGKTAPRPRPYRAGAKDRHVEERLDEALEETFPASDPVSISLCAD
jgi:hypothetical protein